jgi:hypothetical protein
LDVKGVREGVGRQGTERFRLYCHSFEAQNSVRHRMVMIYSRELSIESTRMFRPRETHAERGRERETLAHRIP